MDERTQGPRAVSHAGIEYTAARFIFHLCLALYALALAWLTLRPRPAPERIPLDLMPFDNILDVVREGRSPTYEDAGQLLGNIALFVPLGWLVPMLWRSLRSYWRVLMVAAATSIVIELAQFAVISGRQSSLDDVILNVAGAFVGAVMFFAPRFEGRAETARNHSDERPEYG